MKRNISKSNSVLLFWLAGLGDGRSVGAAFRVLSYVGYLAELAKNVRTTLAALWGCLNILFLYAFKRQLYSFIPLLRTPCSWLFFFLYLLTSFLASSHSDWMSFKDWVFWSSKKERFLTNDPFRAEPELSKLLSLDLCCTVCTSSSTFDSLILSRRRSFTCCANWSIMSFLVLLCSRKRCDSLVAFHNLISSSIIFCSATSCFIFPTFNWASARSFSSSAFEAAFAAEHFKSFTCCFMLSTCVS
mmetsp:Transcript_9478/g.28471  ORF Transcript_9478/g.28471 Transcript_9478/m.28471 type:complete len:244 (-) Transcript_9478:604-1335(-)